MRYLVFVFCAALVCGNAVQVKAQEIINQDVRVVQEYTPTLSDANKISLMPVVDDTISLSPEFNYRIISKPVTIDYKPQNITPARLVTNKKTIQSKSYAKAGLGNYSSGLLEIGYNLPESEDYLLGIKAGNSSSFGDVKLEDGSEVDAPFYDTFAEVGFKRLFDDKTLSVDLDFLHNVYRYYGLQSINQNTTYYRPEDSKPLAASLMAPDERNRISTFGAKLNFSNNNADLKKTSYNVGLGLNTFGSLNGVAQNGFLLSGKVLHPTEKINLGLGLSIENYKTSVADSVGATPYSFEVGNTSLIQLNPNLNFELDNLKLKVGVLMAAVGTNNENTFFLAPDILADLTVVEGIVSLYGGLTGNVDLNDVKTISFQNPFVSPDATIKPALYGLNVIGGVKGNFSSSTSFSTGVSYAFFNDEHFYVNKYYSTLPNDASAKENWNYSNQFEAVYDDGTLLTVSGEFMYKPKSEVEVILSGNYYGWTLDKQVAAWHKPDFSLGIDSRFKVFDDLFLRVGMSYLGQRKVLDYSFDDTIKTLEGVFDFNLGADYYFSNRWTLWADLNNAAASKYYKWNGYPMQRFNAKAGITFSF